MPDTIYMLSVRKANLWAYLYFIVVRGYIIVNENYQC